MLSSMENLEIIYQDSDLIAVNKPPGISVHKTEIDPSSHCNIMTLLRDQVDHWVYPVHRLDRPTSGVLLFACHSEAAKKMVEQFADRSVKKNYLAVVRGYTAADGKIDYPLSPKNLKRQLGASKKRPAQSAITTYQTLDQVELNISVGRYPTTRYSLIEVSPHTGRHRQIRRHMKHIFHPIIGDTSYGDGVHNRFFREHYHCSRLLLHAHLLKFEHPTHTSKEITLKATLDSEFQGLLDQFSWHIPMET